MQRVAAVAFTDSYALDALTPRDDENEGDGGGGGGGGADDDVEKYTIEDRRSLSAFFKEVRTTPSVLVFPSIFTLFFIISFFLFFHLFFSSTVLQRVGGE